jgi:putative redox protein
MNIKLTKVHDSSTRFIAKNALGHEVIIENSSVDSPSAPSPMELILMAISGCSSIDIVHILEKQKISIAHLEVNVVGVRKEEVPRVFTEIQLEVIMRGDIPKSKALRAIELSFKKYCSVSKMLEKTVATTYTLILNDEKVEA